MPADFSGSLPGFLEVTGFGKSAKICKQTRYPRLTRPFASQTKENNRKAVIFAEAVRGKTAQRLPGKFE